MEASFLDMVETISNREKEAATRDLQVQKMVLGANAFKDDPVLEDADGVLSKYLATKSLNTHANKMKMQNYKDQLNEMFATNQPVKPGSEIKIGAHLQSQGIDSLKKVLDSNNSNTKRPNLPKNDLLEDGEEPLSQSFNFDHRHIDSDEIIRISRALKDQDKKTQKLRLGKQFSKEFDLLNSALKDTSIKVTEHSGRITSHFE